MVKALFRNGTDIFFRRQTNILSAATVIAFAVLISRILGLVKYRFLTAQFTPSEIGVFLAAFKLPNVLFDLIVMGAMTTAFIPVFTSYLTRGDQEGANKIASTILNLTTVVFAVFSVAFFLFAQPVMKLVAPGLTHRELIEVVDYTRIMLIGQTFPLLLGNFLTGILQSHKRFLIPASAPILYNIGIIFGILVLAPSMGLFGVVWGVVIGAILFFLVQIPLVIHLKFKYAPVLDLHHPGVVEMARLFFPRVFGLAVNQIGYLVTFSISSLLGARGITFFSFAQQLAALPVSLFATTISQAALPTLSEEKEKDKNLEAFKKTFLTCLHQILFLVLPAAAILIVLRIPIVRLVYGSAKFDWVATVETGRVLAFLGIGLIFESMTNLIVRGFYSLHDSKTPVVVGVFTVILNVVLAIVAIPMLHLPIWGLALAMMVADTVYAIVLLSLLHFKVNRFNLADLVLPALEMTIAALLTGVFLYVPMKLLDQLVFDTTRTFPLLLLTGTATLIGLTVYLFLTWVFDIKELRAFLALFGKVKRIMFAAEETVSEIAGATPVSSEITQEEKHE